MIGRGKEMTQPATVGTPSPLRYGCLPGQTFYLPIVFVALSRWFCRGIRREKSDGSASHPYQKSVGAHRRGARLFILKTELEPRMDADRHGLPAGYIKRRVHPKDEASDLCNSFLISVHPCESVVLFSSLGLYLSRWRLELHRLPCRLAGRPPWRDEAIIK